MTNNWLIYFSTAFALSLFFSWLLSVWISKKNGKEPVGAMRLGGLAVILAFLLTVWLNPELSITTEIGALLWGAGAILVFGIWDDFADLSWKKQLSFQFLLVIFLIAAGYSVDHLSLSAGKVWQLDGWQLGLLGKTWPVWGSLVFGIWIVALINAVGWTDGIDGLSGMIALLGALALALVSLRPEVGQPALAILAVIFLGAVSAFWLVNFSTGRIQAGTAGSYFFGFFLAASAVMAGTKMVTMMIALAVPLMDFLYVVIQRKMAGDPITRKDRRHLHHKLRALGWSDGMIVGTYGLFLGASLWAGLIFEQRHWKLVFLVGQALFVLALLGTVDFFLRSRDNRKKI